MTNALFPLSSAKARRITAALTAALGLTVSAPAAAAISVVDVAANPQLIFAYIRQGLQYTEELEQGADIANQLHTQLMEYRDFLVNLKGLPDNVKELLRREITNEIARAKSFYTGGPAGSTILLDPNSATYVRDLELVLSSLYTVPMDATAVSNMLSTTVASPDPAAVQVLYGQTRGRYDSVANSIRNVNLREKDSATRMAFVDTVSEQLDSMGDLSQLELMQLMARQNALLNLQLEAAIKLLNTAAMDRYYELLDQISAQARAREVQISRVRNATTNVMTAPFGKIP